MEWNGTTSTTPTPTTNNNPWILLFSVKWDNHFLLIIYWHGKNISNRINKLPFLHFGFFYQYSCLFSFINSPNPLICSENDHSLTIINWPLLATLYSPLCMQYQPFLPYQITTCAQYQIYNHSKKKFLLL